MDENKDVNISGESVGESPKENLSFEESALKDESFMDNIEPEESVRENSIEEDNELGAEPRNDEVIKEQDDDAPLNEEFISTARDVNYESFKSSQGEIKFRKDKSRKRLKIILKGAAFVIVAAVFGGASGAYFSSRQNNNMYSYPNNPSLLQQNNSNTANIPKNSITAVAEMVGPAVVGISGQDQTGRDIQDGSGIIFDSRGYIVTNNHVIENVPVLKVRLAGSSKELTATIVGTDPRSDLAVIKVNAQNLPVAKFGDSSKVRVGDTAIAIGNPLGEEFAGTVTAGIISAVNRQITMPNESGQLVNYQVLQTDAAINPGNSGGALCNAAGEIIGINSLKIGSDLSTQNIEGIGFAISINEAKSIITTLMNYGKVSRPVIGIKGGDAVPEQNNGVKGAYVQEVIRGSSAAAAGMRPSDIIVEFDNTKIETFDDLAIALDKHKIGDTVSCKVWREGKTITLTLKLKGDSSTNS